jgi:hypothetical protein
MAIGISDSYLFFMSILAVVFSMLAYFYYMKQNRFLKFGIITLISCLTMFWTVFHFLLPSTTLGAKLDSARINVPSDSAILTFQGSLWDFITPDSKSGLFDLFGKEWDRPIGAEFAPDLNYYVGISVIIFAGLYFAKKQRVESKKILETKIPSKASISKKNSTQRIKDNVLFQKILVANFLLFLKCRRHPTSPRPMHHE